ncbi:hypothetical protein VIGAN_08265800, partial [Vigna angularis var. angularis]
TLFIHPIPFGIITLILFGASLLPPLQPPFGISLHTVWLLHSYSLTVRTLPFLITIRYYCIYRLVPSLPLFGINVDTVRFILPYSLLATARHLLPSSFQLPFGTSLLPSGYRLASASNLPSSYRSVVPSFLPATVR